MKAVLFTAPDQLEISDVPDPVPPAGWVVVAPAAVGICGTDLHILEGDLARGWPTIPGHEFASEVVAVGRDAHGLKLVTKSQSTRRCTADSAITAAAPAGISASVGVRSA